MDITVTCTVQFQVFVENREEDIFSSYGEEVDESGKYREFMKHFDHKINSFFTSDYDEYEQYGNFGENCRKSGDGVGTSIVQLEEGIQTENEYLIYIYGNNYHY